MAIYFAAKNKENMTEDGFCWIICNFLENWEKNPISPLKSKFTPSVLIICKIGYFFELAYPKVVFLLILKILVSNKK